MQVVTYLHSSFHESVTEASGKRAAVASTSKALDCTELDSAMPLELEKAFDAALAMVDRLLDSGMKTTEGRSARPQLQKLEMELKRERANAVERNTVDRAWLQRTVRWVVEWVPDDELTLVAALGRIVRAAPQPRDSARRTSR
jgi:hypothetical protein